MNYSALYRWKQAALLSVCFVSFTSVAPAQTQVPASRVVPPSLWNELLPVRSRMTACHVVWKRVQRINPNPQANPQERASRALAVARKQGLSQEEVQQQVEAERQDALISKQGRVINSTLDFTRIGNTILCRIEYPNYGGQAVEFSNGTDSLFVQTQVKGQRVSADGALFRNPEEVLKFSANGYQVARFLTGIPVDQQFSVSNPAASEKDSSLRISSNGDVVLERDPRYEGNQLLNPDAMTFNRQEFFPVSASKFMTLLVVSNKGVKEQKGDLSFHVLASGYKKYFSGLWFPSKVTVTSAVGNREYSLVKAEFNDQVDPAALKLPPSLRVADFRFGHGSEEVNYLIKDGKIPSDEYVKSLIKTDKQATQAKAKDSEDATRVETSASPFIPTFGLGFIMLGGLMLLGGNRKRN